jgi:hypothetical protein
VPKKPVVVIMDATFFSRSNGLLIFRVNKKNIYWKEIDGEKIMYYEECLNTLVTAGFKFSAFVIDGRRGVKELLLKMFPNTPIQFCQFHQVCIITRYITRRPRLEAGKKLKEIVSKLKCCDEQYFSEELKKWHQKWQGFLKERTIDDSKRGWHYTHKRLRSAYFSLLRNLSWLFTCRNYPKFNIPNTTNSCDGSFSHWKGKVSLHRGLRKDRRKKMIDYFLKNS